MKFSTLIRLTFGNSYSALEHKPQIDVGNLNPAPQQLPPTAHWISTVSMYTI